MKYILYCRKSTEDSDRQIQSIEDQKRAMEELAQTKEIEIVKTLSESKSAKEPGRPEFEKMLKLIRSGKADGIITWKLDRLARNPMDGGNIIWMLQQGLIKKIVTNDKSYHPHDNVLMMSVEFGMANQFILDLSKNVKRGMKSKCEKGWKPGLAPIGYLNDLSSKTIIPDPERNSLIRKMWDLMLTGCYTPEKIAKIARDEWKLTSPQRKKSGGVPMSRTTAYKIFKNPFYYGEFEFNGETHLGAHQPIITRAEFDQVQKILGRNGNPRAKKKEFAFTGILKCAECGCSITAEQKIKYNKADNNIRTYTYYHCTKKKGHCSQKSIEEKKLEKQVLEQLEKIEISEVYLKWVQKNLRLETDNELKNRVKIQKTVETRLKNQSLRLDNLIKLKISPQNTDGLLLSDDEFISQKNQIVKEKETLLEKMKELNTKQNDFIDIASKVFDFCRIAKEKFENGTFQDKKLILSCIGSNLVLKDREVRLELRKVFSEISEHSGKNNRKHGGLEPDKILYRSVLRSIKTDSVSSGWGLGRMLELFFKQISYSPITLNAA